MPHPLTRREMLRRVAGATALVSLTSVAHAATESSAPTAQPMKRLGNLRHSVCKWCYKNVSLEDLCRAAKETGMESIELLGPEDWPTLRAHGLTCAMANGASTIPDGFNVRENHARLVPAFHERIRAAAAAEIPSVICFSGNRRKLSDEEGLDNCVIGLKQIVAEAEKARVTICMELLNSRVNHPDYQCDRTPWGVELVKRVGSERFKLLYDIYHMQIMEGDVIRTIRDNHAYIGHYHTAGNPGRHEFTRDEDNQELNYPAIMRAIRDTGYRAFIGQEFVPTREPLGALRDAVAMCDV